MCSGISAIQTSVSHANCSENFLNVAKSRNAVTNIIPELTFSVIAVISLTRFGFIGPTEVTASTKYTQFLSSRYNTTSGILSCKVISKPIDDNLSTSFTKSF